MTSAGPYPQLALGPDFGPKVGWENAALLFVLQGSQGLIGHEIRALSVQAEPQRVVIHACLREDSAAVTEDLVDLVDETETLMVGVVEPMVDVIVSKYIGDTGPERPGYHYGRLFLINDRET